MNVDASPVVPARRADSRAARAAIEALSASSKSVRTAVEFLDRLLEEARSAYLLWPSPQVEGDGRRGLVLRWELGDYARISRIDGQGDLTCYWQVLRADAPPPPSDGEESHGDGIAQVLRALEVFTLSERKKALGRAQALNRDVPPLSESAFMRSSFYEENPPGLEGDPCRIDSSAIPA